MARDGADGSEREGAEPGSVDDARAQIAETRRRMSEDIDRIERRISDTTAEVKERLDLFEPLRREIRSRPWPALAVAFGAGVVLGFALSDDRKRGVAGRATRSTLKQLPGALLAGIESGLRDVLREQWSDRERTHARGAAPARRPQRAIVLSGQADTEANGHRHLDTEGTADTANE